MELNLDCMRDILLAVESLGFDQALVFSDLSEKLTNYSDEELYYGCYNLYEAKLIDLSVFKIDGTIIPRTHEILDITFSGHEFLSKIRDKNRWGMIKSGASAIRDYSLSAISAIAEGVTSAAISAYFAREKGHQEFFL